MVELRFENVKVQAGHQVKVDLEVLPGAADTVEILTDFPPGAVLDDWRLEPQVAYEIHDLVIDSHRPIFQFKHAGKVQAKVQVQLSSGHPRVLGKIEGDVLLR